MVILQVSYIGYKTKTISDIELKDGLHPDIVIELDADVISVTEVKVQAERKRVDRQRHLLKNKMHLSYKIIFLLIKFLSQVIAMLQMQ